MTTRFEVIRDGENLITAAMDLAAAERHLPQGSAVARVEDNLAGLVHAARRFMGLVESLEPGQMPRSWRPRDEPRERAS